jgi:tripartite-type tricarboxylate transporter receptor subunit TctC
MMLRAFICGVVAVLAALSPAIAQTYPARTVTIVVPVAPGGVSDTFARGLAADLSKAWQQSVVVENRAGAEHVIGAATVAKAEPDGYTLLLTEGTAMVPSLYGQLPYDPQKDFAPISGLIGIHQAVVVHPSVPAATMAELVSTGRSRPGGLNFGSFGSGGRLGMEWLKSATGMKLTAVHYRGSTPMLSDLLAGHIDLSTVNVGSAVNLSKEGKIRMLAVTSATRLPQLPDVPTVAETVPNFETSYWFGLFAPAGAPRAIVEQINGAVRRVVSDPAFLERFVARQMFQPLLGSADEFAAYIKADADKWARIAAGAK